MVERILELCKKHGTNPRQVEIALGFANGSLKKSKLETIQASRVKKIADYFNVSMEYLMTGISDPPAKSLIYIPTHDSNFMKWVKKLSDLPEEYRKEIYNQIDYQTGRYEKDIKEKEGASNA